MAVRRWQKSRRIYVRPRTGPQSAHLWWPAVAKLQAAASLGQLHHLTDQWRFHAVVGVGGHMPPKSWLAPNLAVLLTQCGQLILRKISKFDAMPPDVRLLSYY